MLRSSHLPAHHNYIDINFKEDILPEGDMWNGDNVIFTMTSK